jgi:hypothetical protein
MITFSEPTEWRNSSVLKVSGITIRPGTFTSREGIVTPFTKELCRSLFSNFSSSTPLYLTHDDRNPCGYMNKLGYDSETDMIHYEGYVFDQKKAERIVNEGFDSVSPEIEFDVINGVPINGSITGNAFVRQPAISGTTVTKQMVAFSTPSHVWDYGKSDSAWSKPSLNDFTDKSWEELTASEKRNIAGHYAYAANMPPVSFGDLKFPHHDTKSHAVVWSAVSNAMARLNQSGISDSDKKAVYKHLSSHYAEFKKEPPRMFDNGSVDIMNTNTSYSLTADNGMYMFTPSTTTGITTSGTGTGGYSASYGFVDIDAKDKEIAELKKKLASFEGAVAVPIVPATPVVQAPVPPAINITMPPVVQEQPKPDAYKEKYESMLKTQVDTVTGELRNLGAKSVETIGAGLDTEQRFVMLRSLKEAMVINAPTTTPPATIIAQPVGVSREAKIEQLMKENGIDPEYKKYLIKE